jgi:hypothetical protein
VRLGLPLVRKALEFSPQLLLHSRVWDHNQEWHRVLQQHWEEVHGHSQAIQHKQVSGESI